VATSFTSSANRHGGQESTLLALNNTFYHWGSLIVPPGYTNQVLYAAGGNPYGASYPAGLEGDPSVTVEALTAAHYQGFRLAQYASLLVARDAGANGQRDGGSSDPLGLDPYDPPQQSIFAGQGREAGP
jgi:NAD(P)H dehydrogenase (quinone)